MQADVSSSDVVALRPLVLRQTFDVAIQLIGVALEISATAVVILVIVECAALINRMLVMQLDSPQFHCNTFQRRAAADKLTLARM
jgi:hypothetical protein